MLVVFLCLLPFWRFKIPNKKYWLPVLFFSLFMGFFANLFMGLSLKNAVVISPIIIGSQLAIPFAILLSSFFLFEKVSSKQWLFIFISFFGVVLIGFDPELKNELLSLILIVFMAFFYGGAQVISRYLKDLDVILTNSLMSLFGFVFLLLASIFFEGKTLINIQNISINSWLLILHAGIFVSIGAHMSMFYLYKIYPVKKVFPFYALFPVFGVIQTYIIFNELLTILTFFGGIIVIVAIILLNKEN